MPDVKLKIDGREVELSSGVTTLGRTSDNMISFSGDANVSRYHAEIEKRGNEFCLIDLGSSNGTTVNGEKLTGERFLKAGDVIVLGGTSRIEFGSVPEEAREEEPATSVGASPSFNTPSITPTNISGAMPNAGAAPSGGPNMLLLIAGGVVCVAVLFVAVAAAVYIFSGSSCNAKATITKPETGDTISAATEIEIDVLNGECVSKAVFTVDGKEFAVVEAPFTASIDPKDFPELSDGVDHSLAVTLIDESGQPIGENAAVMLPFETRAVTKPKDETEVTQTNTQQTTPTGGTTKQVSLIEIQEMNQRLVKQFSGQRAYNVSNKQFLVEVQKRTAEYAQEGYFERAMRYRDAINIAFVREQNLDAPLGFFLAMSRSKFDPAAKGSEEGLWKMNTQFVTANAYNGLCGSETLSDASQNCAAKASALYMKAIVFGVFDGDPIYSAAVFGKSPQEAGVWKATLPANRTDVWNAIRTPQEREQLVRFFAAGIVAENPQKFGLKKDRPLSELYRLAM